MFDLGNFKVMLDYDTTLAVMKLSENRPKLDASRIVGLLECLR